MGGSSSSSSSKPKDVTPQAFKNLQQPFADVLSNLLGQYAGSQGNQNLVTGYQGPLTSGGPTLNESSALAQLQQYTQNQVGQQQPVGGGGTQTQPTQPTTTPANDPATQQLLQNTAQSGSTAQSAADFVKQLGIAGNDPQALSDFMSQLAGASSTGAFGGDANNPFLQSYIQAAQRQTQQALEETLGRTLPGRFALAGQQTQPGSSSAFDRAAAIATRGASDSLADIATNISYQALEAARGREATALGEELGRRGTADLQTQQLESTAQQNQLDRALQAPQIQANLNQSATQDELTRAQTQTQNAQTSLTQSQVTAQDVNTMIQNLQAQALPRLIEDLGVERGMEAFNNNINAILSGLGLAAGVTRPVIANESKSSSGSVQLK